MNENKKIRKMLIDKKAMINYVFIIAFPILLLLIGLEIYVLTIAERKYELIIIVYSLLEIVPLYISVHHILGTIRYCICVTMGKPSTARVIDRKGYEFNLYISLYYLVIEYEGKNGKTYFSTYTVSKHTFMERCIGEEINVYKFKNYAAPSMW